MDWRLVVRHRPAAVHAREQDDPLNSFGPFTGLTARKLWFKRRVSILATSNNVGFPSHECSDTVANENDMLVGFAVLAPLPFSPVAVKFRENRLNKGIGIFH